jgi:dGTPase
MKVPTNEFYSEWDMETFRNPRSIKPEDPRSVFEIDRDRICYSSAFRRLQSKTQVFQSGEYDFYRTRLTHSMEVAHVGRSLAVFINRTSPLFGDGFFIDEALVEGICLAHDLGHPPFGHIGERKLNDLMKDSGGFEGNAQTLRILTELIYYQGNGTVRGMCPTRAFLDGILKYKELWSTLKKKTGVPPENHFLYDFQADCLDFVSVPSHSIECQIMDWADDAAYCLHDIIDGVRAGFICEHNLRGWLREYGSAFCSANPIVDIENVLAPIFDAIQKDNIELCLSRKIGSFIHCAEIKKANQIPEFAKGKTKRYDYELFVDPAARGECELYKQLALNLIFQSAALQRYEFKGGMILDSLFEAICAHYIGKSDGLKILPKDVAFRIYETSDDAAKLRLICDYLSELTDRQAIQVYKRLYHPDFGSITDLA